MPPQSLLHPTAQQVQGATTRPIQAASLFSSEAKQEERDPPPIAGPFPLGSLGLRWHRPLSPQQTKRGGGGCSPHRDPVSGGAPGRGLPAGRGGGHPHSQRLEQRGKRAAPTG